MYLELLIAHCFIEQQPDATAAELNEATRRKMAILESGETELHVLRAVQLPSDLTATAEVEGTSGKLIRGFHSRLLGAIAVAADYVQLKRLFQKYYLRKKIPATSGLSFKTTLQEFVQARGDGLPVYNVIGESGPEHLTSICRAIWGFLFAGRRAGKFASVNRFKESGG
jgi:dsRNA-specific ribonuclease